jgi:glycosyltransferase involved in cell wall biosynthesis
VLRLARASLADGRALRRALADQRPDVILVGNFFGLSAALWNVLVRAGPPLVLDVSNPWLEDLCSTHGNWFRIWEKRSRSAVRSLVKGMFRGLLALGPVSLRTRFPGIGAARVYATATHLAETLAETCPDALPPVEICPSGIDLAAFPYRPADRPVRRLLYAGRIKPTKGVHTGIAAMENLDPSLTLTVAGPVDDAGYLRRLRADAGDRIDFRDPVPREEMCALYAEHDVLVFPSEWDEPFSRLVLEAMACGLPVVTTLRGGTADVAEDGENAIVFPAGDAAALAAGVTRLAGDDALRRAIVDRARADVEGGYTLERMVDRIERVLASAVGEA